MANEENLKPPTTSEARNRGKKGGIKSGKARKERKAMKETAEMILGLTLKDGTVTDLEDIQSMAAANGKNITVQDAIILKQAQKALKGDIRAAEFIRDTSGNRPTNEQRMDVAVDNGFIEALNAAVEEVEQCSSGSH
jgi:hypothetical protein|uniref:Uncharacterized protein n=1 Tax=Myoviridae sp. ctegP15 TaxID=2825146 RepID=A0A8S5P2A2_9CAUD|nr:MAG TPA: hypothetical protein [Myoviridae sp. ctegP15]